MSDSDELALTLRELREKEVDVHLLGQDWFTFVDDISPEDLGKLLKTFVFRLGWQDEFIVEVHENGALMTYTPTGMTHYTKNRNMAFSIGWQLKSRSRTLDHMMGK